MIGAVASLHPLLARAELCLLARSVLTDPSSDHWPNRGTGGRALDGNVVSTPSYLGIDETDDIADATDVAGPAMYTTFTPPPPATAINVPYDARMFDIPADVTDHELDDGAGTDSFAITIVLTPLYDNPTGVRFLWNYEDDIAGPPPVYNSLLSSQYGTVIENVSIILDPNDPNDDPLGGDWLPGAASFAVVQYTDPPDNTTYLNLNAVGNFEDLEDPIVGDRHAITLRVDRSNDVLTVWRNGEPIPDPNGFGNLTGIGQLLTSANKVKIGGGQACHAVIWHKRLLTDAEVVRLHGLFV